MHGVVSVSVSLNTKRIDIFWALILGMKCFLFKPVASIGDIEVEVPGLDVSECSPGRHVGGGHARAALALSCHNTDDISHVAHYLETLTRGEHQVGAAV